MLWINASDPKELLFISPAGRSGRDEESRLSEQSAQFPQTSAAQTGELRGFSAVEDQQTKSYHCAGD